MAYVAGEPLTTAELLTPMIEAVGGEMLGDRVLHTVLKRRLALAEIEIGPEQIETERRLILRSLADDPDEAARLLRELRTRRGWGDQRFADLLERNAGLRAMVADQVTVTDGAVQREYRLRYGPATRVRLITVSSLRDAQDLRRRAEAGGSFAELAALHSTDPSAAAGGLLSPIREDDTSYPDTLRAAIAALEPGQVSSPLGLDGQFALVRVEEKIAGAEVEFDDVKGELATAVRARAERVLMQQLARELVSDADVVVLDPTLKALWEAQRKALLRQP
ncbi:MAG: peptidyl-prolyl cis-trans isomerase [Planctomycetota bacterium]